MTAPVLDRPAARAATGLPELSIVAPSYNERANVAPLVAGIAAAMGDAAWELLVVDDDSPDGTADEVDRLAREGWPVRSIRRVGRRGLSSAVVEGALAAAAPVVAVIDADGQHDERLLPRMLDLIRGGGADLVVGSRHAAGGSLGDWAGDRALMSRFATWCARSLVGADVTDPMSGFFAIRRDALHGCVRDLSQQGYKILLDILSSSAATLRVAELPYTFRTRTAGASKLDAMVVAEFLFLLVEKLTAGLVPPRFVLFCLVGGLGVLVHVALLHGLMAAGSSFLGAQAAATFAAMTSNFLVNNAVTYRPERLRGGRALTGYLLFCLVCTVGAIGNIGVADLVLVGVGSWAVAGVAGAAMSAVFNFSVASRLVWGRRRRRRRARG